MRNMYRKFKGFTLLEVLIVLVVLAVLAGLAIPRLAGMAERARVGEAMKMISKIRQAEELYFAQTGSYTADHGILNQYGADGVPWLHSALIPQYYFWYEIYPVPADLTTQYNVRAHRTNRAGGNQDWYIEFQFTSPNTVNWTGAYPYLPANDNE